MQLARAKKKLPSLRKKIEALLEKHAELFWGKWHAVNGEDYAHVKWKGGFWERGKLNADDAGSIDSGLGCRSAKLLQSLKTSTGESDLSPIITAFAKHGPFPMLRTLRINEMPMLGQSDVGSEIEFTCKGFAALPAALPELRTLFLCMIENFDFASFPKLTKLKIASAPPTEASLKALFATDLPRLKNLELIFSDSWPGPEGPKPINLPLDLFAPLAQGKIFPQLKKLAIHAAQEEGTFAADIERYFKDAPIAKRLEVLEIDDSVTLGPDEDY